MISWATMNATQQLVAAAVGLACVVVYSPMAFFHWYRSKRLESLLLFIIASHWMVDAAQLTWWAIYRVTGAGWMLLHGFGQFLPSLKIPVGLLHLWMARGHILRGLQRIWRIAKKLVLEIWRIAKKLRVVIAS